MNNIQLIQAWWRFRRIRRRLPQLLPLLGDDPIARLALMAYPRISAKFRGFARLLIRNALARSLKQLIATEDIRLDCLALGKHSSREMCYEDRSYPESIVLGVECELRGCSILDSTFSCRVLDSAIEREWLRDESSLFLRVTHIDKGTSLMLHVTSTTQMTFIYAMISRHLDVDLFDLRRLSSLVPIPISSTFADALDPTSEASLLLVNWLVVPNKMFSPAELLIRQVAVAYHSPARDILASSSITVSTDLFLRLPVTASQASQCSIAADTVIVPYQWNNEASETYYLKCSARNKRFAAKWTKEEFLSWVSFMARLRSVPPLRRWLRFTASLLSRRFTGPPSLKLLRAAHAAIDAVQIDGGCDACSALLGQRQDSCILGVAGEVWGVRAPDGLVEGVDNFVSVARRAAENAARLKRSRNCWKAASALLSKDDLSGKQCVALWESFFDCSSVTSVSAVAASIASSVSAILPGRVVLPMYTFSSDGLVSIDRLVDLGQDPRGAIYVSHTPLETLGAFVSAQSIVGLMRALGKEKWSDVLEVIGVEGLRGAAAGVVHFSLATTGLTGAPLCLLFCLVWGFLQSPSSIPVSLTASSFGCAAGALVGNTPVILAVASLAGSYVGSELRELWLVEYEQKGVLAELRHALRDSVANRSGFEDVVSEYVVKDVNDVRLAISELL